MLTKNGISPPELLYSKEPIYNGLGLEKKKLSDEELVELKARYINLVQRSIVEKNQSQFPLVHPGV